MKRELTEKDADFETTSDDPILSDAENKADSGRTFDKFK
jgi:hypothetical protein